MAELKDNISLMYPEVYKTYLAVKDCLNTYGKCALIRPTGFGKTLLLMQLAYEYKRVLYIYPKEIILLAIDRDYDGLVGSEEFNVITNAKITRKRYEIDDLLEDVDYDLIIFDEMQYMGARGMSVAVEQLIAYANEKGIHYIGATATPSRATGPDVVDVFFDNRVVYPFDLADAFDTGFFLKPDYTYAFFERDIEKLMGTRAVKRIDPRALSRGKLAVAQLKSVDTLMRESIDRVYGDVTEAQEYFKILIFCPSKAHIEANKKKIMADIKKALPEYKVNVPLIITSDAKYRENVKEIDKLKFKQGWVDVILCIDMLNLGYHVGNLTAVGLMRGTHSAQIMTQQVGRIFTKGRKFAPIIWDFVGNLGRNPFFAEDSAKLERMPGGKRYRRAIPTQEHFIVHGEAKALEDIIAKLTNGIPEEAYADIIARFKAKQPLDDIMKHYRIQSYFILEQFLIEQGYEEELNKRWEQYGEKMESRGFYRTLN